MISTVLWMTFYSVCSITMNTWNLDVQRKKRGKQTNKNTDKNIPMLWWGSYFKTKLVSLCKLSILTWLCPTEYTYFSITCFIELQKYYNSYCNISYNTEHRSLINHKTNHRLKKQVKPFILRFLDFSVHLALNMFSRFFFFFLVN